MGKFAIILLFTLTTVSLNAQNLVPNPSFEDTVSCPTTANQLNNCEFWSVVYESPDYFHECAFITSNIAVPYNFVGFQYASTGSAYVGLFTYSLIIPNEREIITSELISPLIQGQKYFASMKVSWSGAIATIASNRIGMFFSTQFYTPGSSYPVSNLSQVNSNMIISDSVNWVTVSGSFIADSNYQYILIGNFFDDLNTDTIQFQPVTSYAYYYIDDILVELDTTVGFNDELKNSIFSIQPNPVEDEFNINTTTESTFTLSIFDMKLSKCHFKKEFSQKEVSIDLRHFASGIYICRIFYDQNQYYYFKIIKT